MSSQSRLADTFVFKCALLLLAFSVFAWGLHAKLSLYNTTQSSYVSSVAKLSTEKRAAQTMASIERAAELAGVWEWIALFSLLSSFHLISLPTIRFHQIRLSLCRPCRCDLQAPDLMHRPPPVLA